MSTRKSGADGDFVETAALHADDIDGANLGGIAVGDHERRDVLDNLGTTPGDNVIADAAELMHRSESADDDVISHSDVSRQGAVVGKDAVIADHAIVGDVRVGEEVSVTADDGGVARCGGAIYGGEFAKSIALANPQPGRFGVIL